MDATWVDRVDAEVDNVRGALDFADATGQSQRILSATASLRDFWFTRGYITGGRTRLEDALAADAEPTPARCSALIAASSSAAVVCRRCSGRPAGTSTRRWSLADSLGDARLSALATLEDAWLLTEDERWSDALAILDEVIPVLRELGAWDVAIPANRTRAWVYEELGDMDRFLAADRGESGALPRAWPSADRGALARSAVRHRPSAKVGTTKPATSSCSRIGLTESSGTSLSLASILVASRSSIRETETWRSPFGSSPAVSRCSTRSGLCPSRG